jgi:N-acetylmuramoyl-L-alanine amidase
MKRPTLKKAHWLFLLVPLALIAFFLLKKTTNPTPDPAPAPPIQSTPNLAELALPPDWSLLERFQNTLSRETFLNRLETIYTKDNPWKKWISIDEEKNTATIGDFILNFSEKDQPTPGAIFNWKVRQDLSPARTLPLQGLHIALDPGHIGGDFARLEGREFTWRETVIREGTMTLRTAELLAPLLEELGACVTLVRTKLEPVTKKRSSEFSKPRLFYRTSEIRARAELVNETIKPDLVICLHFNGTSSRTPELSQHFHIILNGTYLDTELAHEDERFQMLQRLLSGTITEEIPLARQVAASFNELAPLPAYKYPASLATAQNVANHPNLWARNLLANRLYQCPVIFMEPYVMNSVPFIARFNKDPESIYREYARAVANGLARYYSQQ